MVELIWSSLNSRHETGVDKGVLFLQNADGVPWNGLVSVEESSPGAEVDSQYYDGNKYLDVVANSFYQAKLSAFTYPVEFEPCLGEKSLTPGLLATQQPLDRFSFCYRTIVGDNLGYKIHVVYNAVAILDTKTYNTLSDDASITALDWTIDATPPDASTYRPTSHFIVDSTRLNPAIYTEIESILYGNTKINSHLPTTDTLISFITNWEGRKIIPNPVTGLNQLSANLSGDFTRTEVYGLYQATSNSRLVPTSRPGFYKLGR